MFMFSVFTSLRVLSRLLPSHPPSCGCNTNCCLPFREAAASIIRYSQRFALCAFEVRLKKPQPLALATTKNFGGFYASSAGTGSAPSARDFDDAAMCLMFSSQEMGCVFCTYTKMGILQAVRAM